MGLGSRFSAAFRAFIGGQQPRPDAPDSAPPSDPKRGTPTHRAFATAHVPGWPTGSPLEELEHFTSWNYVGVHTVGKQWAGATVNVYDRSAEQKGRARALVRKSHAPDTPAEQRTPLPDHPAARLLRRPNPLKSGQAFLYQVGTQMRLTGGYVIWEVRNQLGLPMELWVLPRGWLTYQQPTDQYPMGLWRVSPNRRTGYWAGGYGRYAAGFWLDVRDTIVGGWEDPTAPGEYKSPLAACSQIIDITEKMDLATYSALVNAPRPGMLFKTADGQVLTDEQWEAARQRIDVQHAGAANTGKPMLVDGLEPTQPTSAPLSELNSVEIRDQNMKLSMGIQGVPLVAAGIRTDVGSYSADAATLNAFAELQIDPDLRRFAGDLTHRWQRHWGDDFCVEISARRYDDPTLDQAKRDQYLKGFDSGVFNQNEVRAVFGEPPAPDGDKFKSELQPQQVAVGPDGQPMPGGMPGDAGSDMAAPSVTDDDLGDLDLEPSLPDSTRTGFKRPELQAAGGRGFSRNGSTH